MNPCTEADSQAWGTSIGWLQCAYGWLVTQTCTEYLERNRSLQTYDIEPKHLKQSSLSVLVALWN